MKLGKMLKKIHIEPNTVLVVDVSDKYWGGKTPEEVVKEIGDVVNETKIPNVIVVGVASLDAITGANEQFMMRHGWYRMEKLAQVMSIKRSENNDSKS